MCVCRWHKTKKLCLSPASAAAARPPGSGGCGARTAAAAPGPAESARACRARRPQAPEGRCSSVVCQPCWGRVSESTKRGVGAMDLSVLQPNTWVLIGVRARCWQLVCVSGGVFSHPRGRCAKQKAAQIHTAASKGAQFEQGHSLDPLPPGARRRRRREITPPPPPPTPSSVGCCFSSCRRCHHTAQNEHD